MVHKYGLLHLQNMAKVKRSHGVVPTLQYTQDSKVHGANIGPIWGQQDPGGPHVGPMNLAIWDYKHLDASVQS